MRILVLSDTHIPRTAVDLPKKIYDEIKKSDLIIHAGDFVEKEMLEKLRALKDIKAVCGNMDSGEVCRVLKPKEVISVGKFKIGLIHGHGGARDIIDNIKGEFTGVDAVVFGHTHTPVNIVKDGVLYFNPGSPTDTIFTSVNSYGILEVGDKKIEGQIMRL